MAFLAKDYTKETLDNIERQLAAMQDEYDEEYDDQIVVCSPTGGEPLPVRDDSDEGDYMSPSFSPLTEREDRSPSPLYSPPPPPSSPLLLFEQMLRSNSSPPAPLAFVNITPPPTPPSPLTFAEWLQTFDEVNNQDVASSLEVEPPTSPQPRSSPLYQHSPPPPIASPDNVLLYDPVEQLYHEVPAEFLDEIEFMDILPIDLLEIVMEEEEEEDEEEVENGDIVMEEEEDEEDRVMEEEEEEKEERTVLLYDPINQRYNEVPADQVEYVYAGQENIEEVEILQIYTPRRSNLDNVRRRLF